LHFLCSFKSDKRNRCGNLALLKFAITLSSVRTHCMGNLFQSPLSNRRELCDQNIVKWVWNALLQ
jgi:hypothetical protein